MGNGVLYFYRVEENNISDYFMDRTLLLLKDLKLFQIQHMPGTVDWCFLAHRKKAVRRGLLLITCGTSSGFSLAD